MPDEQAGAELDAQIAEKVMERERPHADSLMWWKGDQTVAYRDWSPSTDWAAAGEVLEKKRAEGERICLYCDLDGNWNCWFYTKAGEPSYQATAPTGPLAICLAADGAGEGADWESKKDPVSVKQQVEEAVERAIQEADGKAGISLPQNTENE